MIQRSKVRKEIYLDREQDRLLKRLARDLNVSEAEVIRRSLQGQRLWKEAADESAWEEELLFLKKRGRLPPIRQERERSRDDLYRERLDRVSDRH